MNGPNHPTKRPARTAHAATPASRRRKSVHTINDVAARAGVSIKTVSRVVNREPNVREDTAQKVHRAIRDLRYRPNFSARNLASSRAYLVAVLYDNPSDSYIVSVLQGVQAACEAADYGVLLQPFDASSPRLCDQVHDMLAQRRPSGLVLTPPLCDLEPLLATLDADGTQYVSIAPHHENRGKPFVSVDDVRASFDLTGYLLARGHRRIGFIKADPRHGAASRRLTGYIEAHRQRGIPVDERLIANGLLSFDSGVECARRLLRQTDRPTAIFASNDDMAAGVLHAAHEIGLRVPAELSVAGYDDVPIARYVYPSLTTVRQPIRAMATGAVQCLLQSMRPHHGMRAVGEIAHRFDYEIIIRDSVAPPP
jgi:LacI family transcriptional regulator